MPLLFQRDAKVYFDFRPSGAGNTIFQIPVLAGFSFSQATNSSEITISEAGATSRRARLLFNDSVAPVEWSMSTYIRPTTASSGGPGTIAPEQALWAALMGADGYHSPTRTFYSTLVGLGSPSGQNSPTGSPSPFASPAGSPDKPEGSFVNFASSPATGPFNTFDFSASNVSAFPTTNRMYITFNESGGNAAEYFTLTEVIVNSVTIDFDIEGICTAQWSGFARSVTRSGSAISGLASAVTDGVSGTTNFIRNRISTVSLSKTSSPSQGTYNIVLTGGSFTIENNVSFLIPEQLGQVNLPLGNVTGTRSISGTMTCYYDNNVANFASADLWSDLISPGSTEVRNVFNLRLNLGGTTALTPRLRLELPTAHLEIPSIGVDDLLTLEIGFHGIVNNGDVDQTNEAVITYLS